MATTTTSDGRPGADRRERAGITVPGILLGVGLGGFVDGIVLHQILQWHHMLSSTTHYPATDLIGLKDNTFADGLFHASTWIAATVGVFLLWRAARRGATVRDNRSLLGWVLAGWGVFNVLEGLVDHHILKIHHVREGVGNYEIYDIGFLVFGAVLLIVGVLLGHAGHSRPPVADATTTIDLEPKTRL